MFAQHHFQPTLHTSWNAACSNYHYQPTKILPRSFYSPMGLICSNENWKGGHQSHKLCLIFLIKDSFSLLANLVCLYTNSYMSRRKKVWSKWPHGVIDPRRKFLLPSKLFEDILFFYWFLCHCLQNLQQIFCMERPHNMRSWIPQKSMHSLSYPISDWISPYIYSSVWIYDLYEVINHSKQSLITPKPHSFL